MKRIAAFAGFLLSLAAVSAQAHELWLEPLDYGIATGEKMQAQIKVGQFFEGSRQPFIPGRFKRFDIASPVTSKDVENLPGSQPALDEAAVAPGTHVISYFSKPSSLRFETFEKFETYAENQSLGTAAEDHLARGLPLEGFREDYSRCAKTLIQVDGGELADQETGLRHELVLQGITEGTGTVKLLHRGRIRKDAQVRIFKKSDGENFIDVRTDDNGIATFDAVSGEQYLLSSVIMLELPEGGNAVWESYWASLTFEAP